jgi:glutaredoxin
MRIEILYFRGCPHYEPTVERVRDVVQAKGLDFEIHEVEVRSEAEAQRLRFLGSPTVRIDGVDIQPSAEGRAEFSLSCRMYGGSGIPPTEIVARALSRAH